MEFAAANLFIDLRSVDAKWVHILYFRLTTFYNYLKTNYETNLLSWNGNSTF